MRRRAKKSTNKREGGEKMYNLKEKNQLGITLIALVVTIVVLLILCVVSINIVFGDDGIFGTAKQASEETKEKADFESNQLPGLMKNFIDESVGITNKAGNKPTELPDNNSAPEITTQAYASSRHTDYIYVSTAATDADGDTLTYTLNWGTDTNYGNTETLTGASGEIIEFQKTGLANYTDYYWRIDVSDGKESISGVANSTKTYCSTTECNGNGDCIYCSAVSVSSGPQYTKSNGEGNVCSGEKYYTAIGTIQLGSTITDNCMACGKTYRTTSYHIAMKCNSCGFVQGRLGKAFCSEACAKTDEYWGTATKYNCERCIECDSYGNYTCAHDVEGKHYYCSHGTNYTTTYHE